MTEEIFDAVLTEKPENSYRAGDIVRDLDGNLYILSQVRGDKSARKVKKMPTKITIDFGKIKKSVVDFASDAKENAKALADSAKAKALKAYEKANKAVENAVVVPHVYAICLNHYAVLDLNEIFNKSVENANLAKLFIVSLHSKANFMTLLVNAIEENTEHDFETVGNLRDEDSEFVRAIEKTAKKDEEPAMSDFDGEVDKDNAENVDLSEDELKELIRSANEARDEKEEKPMRQGKGLFTVLPDTPQARKILASTIDLLQGQLKKLDNEKKDDQDEK